MNRLLLRQISQPAIAVPASMALHGGASAYGNVLQENQLQKADGRMILESIMAALGAGAGVLGAASINKRIRAPQYRQLRTNLKRKIPTNLQTPVTAVAPNVVSLALAGAGGGIAGANLAPFLANNLNAVGVPNMSGRQQDFYEEDQPGAPIDKEMLKELLVGILKEQNG